jgi:hypothetical protein
MLFMRDGEQVEANWSPAAVFDEVFPGGLPTTGGGAPDTNADPVELRLRSRLALLGSVGTELSAIECAGGRDARLRLENYLDSMHRIETQIQSLLDEEPVANDVNLDVNLPAGARERSFWRSDDTFREVGQLMTDVAVASLALDRTRVVAMQWSATGFNDHDAYRFVVEETRNAGDHGLSHGHEGENPDALLPRDAARRDRARIHRWYNTQLASFLERLDAIPEGDGTLLDHTLIMTVTDSGGMDHQTYDLPFLTFNAPSARGQYLEVERGRHHADYLLTMAQAMGLSIDSLGEGTRPIDALL